MYSLVMLARHFSLVPYLFCDFKVNGRHMHPHLQRCDAWIRDLVNNEKGLGVFFYWIRHYTSRSIAKRYFPMDIIPLKGMCKKIVFMNTIWYKVSHWFIVFLIILLFLFIGKFWTIEIFIIGRNKREMSKMYKRIAPSLYILSKILNVIKFLQHNILLIIYVLFCVAPKISENKSVIFLNFIGILYHNIDDAIYK